jgi:molybdopterin synthase sulfur carrier subunit
MKIQARFFASFQELFGIRARDVELAGGRTVRDFLDAVCDSPARREGIFSGAAIRPHIVVMVNGVHIQSLQGLRTPLSDGDTVAVFPFLGGG